VTRKTKEKARALINFACGRAVISVKWAKDDIV
jgi:hypothetical protein